MTTPELVKAQRDFFATGITKDVSYRMAALRSLREAIFRREKQLYEALRADLNKSEFESYMTEVGLVLEELRFVEKHLEGWARPHRVPTPLAQFHATSAVYSDPYGVVLVMAPWNYPFQLCLEPVIGALAAGNCVVIKPSAYAPQVSQVIAQLVGEVFEEEYVAVIEGGRQENNDLLAQRFDYIFFTGGVTVGRLVMESAARNLTPMTLELGGKSPCVIDETANLKLAAKRLAFGKFLNAGQTCVAPDYLLVQETVKEQVVEYLKAAIEEFFGRVPVENPELPKIINQRHFQRLMGLMEGEHLLTGGETRGEEWIAPTLVDGITPQSPLMQEEIFGPILPILTFKELQEAIDFINDREKPLALYYFTQDKGREEKMLRDTSSGGGCINDTVIHLATSQMGFGGVGQSGMGSYHGKKSFETFSHQKSIVKKSTWMDLPFRYHPYTEKKQKMIKMFLK